MEKALNKILDIVNDMSMGLSFGDDNRNFLRGYLLALKEIGEINGNEVRMLMRFYDRLVADKKFIVE